MITFLAISMGCVLGFAIAMNFLTLGRLAEQSPATKEEITKRSHQVAGTFVAMAINLYLLAGTALLYVNTGA